MTETVVPIIAGDISPRILFEGRGACVLRFALHFALGSFFRPGGSNIVFGLRRAKERRFFLDVFIYAFSSWAFM